MDKFKIMYKVAIISTHPIQYNAPWFKRLNERSKLKIKVFYTWQNTQNQFFDTKFGQKIEWDIPLLTGYDHVFVRNTSKNPQPHSFLGIQNPELINLVKGYNPDAILIFGWKFYSHLQLMHYFHRKIPILFRGDSTLLDETKIVKSIVRRLVLRFVYRWVDFAFYVGNENKRYFRKYGLKEEQLSFAPHAIDNNRFMEIDKQVELKVEKWKSKLGIKKEDIVVLFVGKFERKKAPFNVVKVALTTKRADMKFLFVGSGELDSQLKKEAPKNCLFLPFQNQSKMPLVYRLGDILILPSQGPGETWGLAVNEAMACGLAAIVSNKTGCYSDLIIEAKTGYVFIANEINQLSEILSKLEKKHLSQMGKNAQQLIKNWNFDKICVAIENSVYLLSEK